MKFLKSFFKAFFVVSVVLGGVGTVATFIAILTQKVVNPFLSSVFGLDLRVSMMISMFVIVTGVVSTYYAFDSVSRKKKKRHAKSRKR